VEQLQTQRTPPFEDRIADPLPGDRHAGVGQVGAHGSDSSPLARTLRLWYRLTAPVEPAHGASFAARERSRRGQLLSVILLGYLVILAGAFYQYRFVDDDHPLMLVVLGAALGLAVVVTVLNRLGQVPLAGALMVLLAELPLAGPFAATKDGQLDILHLGAFYLTVGSLLVAASVLAPWSVFPVALLNCAATLAIFTLRPHTPALSALLGSNDGQQALLGPVAMQGIVAIVAYLWAQNILAALRRADRAEEIAALERREIERQRELEEGVRQLLAVHVLLANGDFTARTAELRNPLLWQVGKSLNILIARVGRYAQAEFLLRREQEEAQRLAEALDSARAGRPVIWPAPSGVPLDVVTEAVRSSQGRSAFGPSGPSGPESPGRQFGTRSTGWSPWPSPTAAPHDPRDEPPPWLQP
jgi:hypothetical protein